MNGTFCRRAHRRTAELRLASIAVLALGASLAGCGSGGSSSTSSTSKSAASTATSSTPAVAAHATPIRGVASPPGALKPSPAALKKLRKVAKPRGITPRIAGLSNLPLDQQLTVLDNDINGFWSNLFAKSKIQWPQTQQVLVQSSPVQTQCTNKPTIAPTDPWFLCDPTFYWPLPWMQQHIAPKGGVELAFNVGIFWSFHVQEVLGFTQALSQGQISKAQWGNQTLCLTGVWARTIGQRNLFEQGDAQALQALLDALQGINGIGPPDVTQQSLSQAFVMGYNNGAPAQCISGSGGGGGGQQTTPTTPTPTGL